MKNLSYDDLDAEEYQHLFDRSPKMKPKLPLWKGAAFLFIFGLLFRYGSQIISFIKTLI